LCDLQKLFPKILDAEIFQRQKCTILQKQKGIKISLKSLSKMLQNDQRTFLKNRKKIIL